MLRVIVEKEAISNRALARAIGIDHASLFRSLQESGNPESRTIEKILDHFGYDIKFIKRKEAKSVKSKPSKKGR